MSQQLRLHQELNSCVWVHSGGLDDHRLEQEQGVHRQEQEKDAHRQVLVEERGVHNQVQGQEQGGHRQEQEKDDHRLEQEMDGKLEQEQGVHNQEQERGEVEQLRAIWEPLCWA